ncbi:MAG: LPS export ABC transporter permease LptG [Nevskiales bacterium]
MIRTLDLYVMRSIAVPTCLVAFTLLVISSIMALVDELETAERIGYGLGVTLQFVVLNLPAAIYQLAPTTMLLGALLGLGALANGSELVVMRASGISIKRIGTATAFGGVLFAAFVFFLGDWLVPLSNETAYDLRTEARYAGQRHSDGGLWLREGNHYIHIEETYAGSHLGRLHKYDFDKNNRLTGTMVADSAVYSPEGWQLSNVRESIVEKQRISTRHSASRLWDVNLDPGLLRLSSVQAESLTAAGLWDYAHYLERNGLDSEDYEVALWRKIAMPITIVVMSLLAIPFVVGSLRSSGAGQRLFVGILLGIGFFLMNEIVGSSGQVYGLQPWATAMLPTLILAVVTLFALDRIN